QQGETSAPQVLSCLPLINRLEFQSTESARGRARVRGKRQSRALHRKHGCATRCAARRATSLVAFSSLVAGARRCATSCDRHRGPVAAGAPFALFACRSLPQQEGTAPF